VSGYIVAPMNESILIVEDEQELCMTLGDRLRSEGYVVDFAAEGQAGLEKATHLPFDLIILDIMMPRRSGLDVCKDIRRAGLATPILLLTARSQTVDKVVGLKLGADDYVTKPFDTLELMARIEALLRRSPGRTDVSKPGGPDFYRFGSGSAKSIGDSGQQACESHRAGIQSTPLLCGASGSYVVARSIVAGSMGTQDRHTDAHRGRARCQFAPEIGAISEGSRNDPDRSRNWIPI